MTGPPLSPQIAGKLAALYQEMEAGYDRVAAKIGLSCQGCPDNCCDSYFFHHTSIEWAYLWHGLATLAAPLLETAVARARQCLDHYREAETAGDWPKIMCPLNEKGLCMLYRYRPMICRCHGVPARLRRPDGKTLHFPGCFRCQELTAKAGVAAEMDRTPLLRRLAGLEEEFLGRRLDAVPKIKMTLAAMLLAGSPEFDR